MTNVKFDCPSKENLPDPQMNQKLQGAQVPIQKVGINNFEYPIDIMRKGKHSIKLKGDFSFYVSLNENFKGINMSRLAILIDELSKEKVGIGVLTELVEEACNRLGSDTAYVKVKFDYPMKQKSVSTENESDDPLEGWKYYSCVLEAKGNKGEKKRAFLTVDFIYSSTCPCSQELSYFAVEKDPNIKAAPHSQRSRAKVTIEFDPSDPYFIEDLVEDLRDCLKTECQVLVKRQQEMLFAIASGEYPKFVEDASRLVFEKLDNNPKIKDFLSVHEHWESLHPHSAVSVIYKGVEGGLR